MSPLINTLVCLCWSFALGQTANTYQTVTGRTCILCPPGYYYIKDCDSSNTIAVCKPCPPGSYASTYNRAVHCAVCMPHCESDVLVTVQECNATMDMVCDCPPGYVLENPTDKFHAKCKPFQVCKPGWGVIEQGTPGHEPLCAKCRPGITFSPEVSRQERCYPCTQCLNNDVLQECNVTHDSICHSTRKSWHVYVAIPSLVANCCLMLVTMIIVMNRRCFRQKAIEQKIDEDGMQMLESCSNQKQIKST